MDFRLTEEQEALRASVREFAREAVAPVIAEHYEQPHLPVRDRPADGQDGPLRPALQRGVRRHGRRLLRALPGLEELARVDSSVAITLEAAVSLGAMPIYRFGTEEQKARWLPKLVSGEALAAFGLTEPGTGSDAGGTTTRAVLDGDEWVINGAKAFITNSGTDITALVTVTAVTGTRPDGSKELSTIIVPSGTPGFTVAPGYSKVGWCASDTHELTFDDCRVPAANLLGERGRGFAQFLRILDEGRIAIAALVGRAGAGLRRRVAALRPRAARLRSGRSATTRRSSSRSPTWR